MSYIQLERRDLFYLVVVVVGILSEIAIDLQILQIMKIKAENYILRTLLQTVL